MKCDIASKIYKEHRIYLEAELLKDMEQVYKLIENAARRGDLTATVDERFFRHITREYQRIDGLNRMIERLKEDGYTVQTSGSYSLTICGWY